MSLRRSLAFMIVLETVLFCLFQSASTGSAQVRKVEIEGYGEISYERFNWETDSTRRNQVDIERAAVEATWELTDEVRLEAEIEFEHGGSGSTMEFDRLEEFGEYESEVEKGGEVVLEKLAVTFTIKPAVNVRVGHLYVPVGLVNTGYEPGEFYTVRRSEMESALLPATWHETGIELFGDIGELSYRALLVNGLDATGFSSATWIKRGRQGKFETVNAENFAVAFRADYLISPGMAAGGSIYFGNSADNRPKPDLDVPATVVVAEAHGRLDNGPLTIQGELLFGHLQNSEAISRANRNLSANLNVKRTPVGSSAMGWFAEIGIDPVMALSEGSTRSKVVLFARYDWYDTMHTVAEGIFNNPRWERSTFFAGVNYWPVTNVVLKGEYSYRTIGIPSDNVERTLALGLGFDF